MRSLHWHFLEAFILIIVIAVLLSAGVGYYITQGRLDAFVTEIRIVEANTLAQNLSQEYTLTGGWKTLELALSEAGYLYDEELVEERPEEGGEESSEFFHQDAVRVVIIDVEGYVVQQFLCLLPNEKD